MSPPTYAQLTVEQEGDTTTVSGEGRISGNFALTNETPTSNAWETSFALGVSFSGLTERQYGIRRNEFDQNILFRDRDAQDATVISSAWFVHVSRRFPLEQEVLGQSKNLSNYGIGPSLGISDGPDGGKNYYVGGSMHLGHQLYITLGVHWGDVKRPPPGERVGEPTELTPDTLPESLIATTKSRVFLSFSYPFAGSQDGFLQLINPAQR